MWRLQAPGFRPRGKLAVHVARSLKSAARRLLTHYFDARFSAARAAERMPVMA